MWTVEGQKPDFLVDGHRRQSWGLGVATPRFWAWGPQGSLTGGKILLYLIMYGKYVRK